VAGLYARLSAIAQDRFALWRSPWSREGCPPARGPAQRHGPYKLAISIASESTAGTEARLLQTSHQYRQWINGRHRGRPS